MISYRLDYQMFQTKFYEEFPVLPKNSDSNVTDNFDVIITQKKLTKGEFSFQGTINWKSTQRPMVGMRINTLTFDLPLALPEGNFEVFQHGYQSWSFSTVCSSSERDTSPILQFLRTSQENFYTEHSGKEGDFQSEGLTVLWDKQEKKGLLISVLPPVDQNVKIRTVLNSGRIEKIQIIYDIFCMPDFKMNTPYSLTTVKFTPLQNTTPEDALEKFGAAFAKKAGIKRRLEPVPTGWCSWYYYFTGITEENILQNLRELKTKNLPVEFFQIDDGYQREIGDWLICNEKFPNGMKYLADEIKKENLKPGIWLAPFLQKRNSSFFKTFPEAILKDEKGNPVQAIYQPIWGIWDSTFCLDVTHPAALDYLERVFSTFSKEYGYSYLKLDFLYAGALDGVTYNSRISPAQRYTQAIQMIRNTVGKNTFLLGCGAPMFPSAGVFDGMRVSCDVTPFWGVQRLRQWLSDRHALCTEKALINGLYRSFMHRNFWLNDPDCLIIRKDKNKMTYDQTILMASVMGLSGGMLLISDNLSTLDTERMPLFHKAVAISRACQAESSKPLGLMEYKFPRGIYNPGGAAGFWNPTEEAAEISVYYPYPLFWENKPEFWTSATFRDYEYDKASKTLKLRLGPFQSVVFIK